MMQRTANQLDVGDVIVAPDGAHHTVSSVDRHGLEGAWLTIRTATGLAIDKSRTAASIDTYDVLTDAER
ncbi:hypothetical protein GS896_25475 [Rhodococcus hoagii]|nr:hypothetical protein [Prescottella equi]MBM4570184.1 hypothetical protein [Prescottella equi]MBM4574920.1 hypothetical protein [Prescottella equi]MBM4654144.1 hypothetical protein [Prescottella equi]MBM4719617.1 hypothetical protein [Prescottella equi]